MIKKVLQRIFPEAKQAEIIGIHNCEDSIMEHNSGIRLLIDRQTKGDSRPLLIYGFDSLKRIKQPRGGSMLDAPGVFYLKLPSSLSHVGRVLQKAVSFDTPADSTINDETIRGYMINKIRSFKHTCDNVWMSMSANANRAKKAIKNLPDEMPDALLELKSERLERLSRGYEELEPMAIQIGIMGADQAARNIEETINLISKIRRRSTSPQKAVEIAFRCVEKMKSVSDIMSAAKELKKSG